MTLSRLRELHEAASRAPWEAVVNDDPRGQPVPFYRGLVATVENGDRYLAVVTDGSTCEQSAWEANARLIASARNALPTILEALEAADAMAEVMVGCIREIEATGDAEGVLFGPNDEINEKAAASLDAFRASLAALDKVLP